MLEITWDPSLKIEGLLFGKYEIEIGRTVWEKLLGIAWEKLRVSCERSLFVGLGGKWNWEENIGSFVTGYPKY